MILAFPTLPAAPPRPARPAGVDANALDAWIPFVHPSGMEGSELISTSELCRRFGVTRGAVRLWVADGLPLAPETPVSTATGRPIVLMFRVADVAAFVEARKAAGRWKQGPSPEPAHSRSAGPDRTQDQAKPPNLAPSALGR